MRNHIEEEIRLMLVKDMENLRKLEFVRDSENHRSYLSGRLSAFEELLKLIGEVE
jgi:hypothetical protein